MDYLSTQSCCAGYLGISDWLLLGTSDRKRHCEKRLIKEKRGANLELGRRCLGQGVLCWTVSALPNLSASFSRVKWAELKGSNPQPRGKACCHLISGTYEEMKRSRGRIRDQRMRPAGERAEGKLTEPTGVEFSVTNFLPLPYPFWDTVSKGATPARLRMKHLRETSSCGDQASASRADRGASCGREERIAPQVSAAYGVPHETIRRILLHGQQDA